MASSDESGTEQAIASSSALPNKERHTERGSRKERTARIPRCTDPISGEECPRTEDNRGLRVPKMVVEDRGCRRKAARECYNISCRG
jgi:hypothetical protein